MLTIRRFRWLSFKARTWRRVASFFELLWILPIAAFAAKKAIGGFEVANAYGDDLARQQQEELKAEKAAVEAEEIRRDEAMLDLAKEKRRHGETLIRHAELLEKEVALSTELRELRKADDASAT